MSVMKQGSMWVVIFLCVTNVSLFAYIDPGTGSLLVSTLIGIMVVLLYSLKNFFYRVVTLLYGRGKNLNNDFSGKIIFFNEGKNYWNVFKPVLDACIDKEMDIVYLSADKSDPGLALTHIEAHYIGNIPQAMLFLKSLKADICVMTTPQLHILMLKRSNDVLHYCHLIHSPDDIHTYKKFAFDYFDSVLCSSASQIKHIRELEQKRGNPAKLLFKTGCTYYDVLGDFQKNEDKQESEYKTILLAPTWGEKSFFSQYGIMLIELLLEKNYHIIFRPHPQSWISERELLEYVTHEFEKYTQFAIDREINNNKSMAFSDIMICDLSGVVYDYVCVHKKPVIAVLRDEHMKGYEGYNISGTQSTVMLLEKVGKLISMQDVPLMSDIVETLLNVDINQEIIDKYVYNFQRASHVAAEQILHISEQINAEQKI